VDGEEVKDDDLGFQRSKRDLKAIYDHSDFESCDNERGKILYVMFRGSWDITSSASSKPYTERWRRPRLHQR
jgi:hypothetical protein